MSLYKKREPPVAYLNYFSNSNGRRPTDKNHEAEPRAIKGFDTAQAFRWIGTYTRSQNGLDHLLIMCHGGVKSSEIPNQNLQSMALNERGLQIGKENLLHSNLHVTAVLKSYQRGILSALFGVAGTIDFGQWEGPVYSFMPDGKMKSIK